MGDDQNKQGGRFLVSAPFLIQAMHSGYGMEWSCWTYTGCPGGHHSGTKAIAGLSGLHLGRSPFDYNFGSYEGIPRTSASSDSEVSEVGRWAPLRHAC